MKKIARLLMIVSLIQSCDQVPNTSTMESPSEIIPNMSDYMAELRWMNQPDSFIVEEGILKVSVYKGSDFFNSPEDSSVVGTASYLYKTIAGDFVAKALVQPDFSSLWNAVALMVYMDSLHWIKFAFENSDATGPGIVSVVTKETSDDANGVILNMEKRVWLAIARKNNIYSMHWSTDGKDYKMTRLTSMRNRNEVKIGIEMQCPVGKSAIHSIACFDVKEITLENMRVIN